MSGVGAVGFALVGVVGGGVVVAGLGIAVGMLVAARTVDLVGAGLSAVGERAERSRAEWMACHAALLEWEAAARRVIDVNARLDVLRQHSPADLAAALPAALMPCAQSPAELDAWCASTANAVVAVEEKLRERTAAAVLNVLRHSVDLERPVTAQEAFRRYHEAMADEAMRQQAVPSEALEAVGRIVARLTPDANDEDRADVLAAASQVAVRRADVGYETMLSELRLRVQRAEERVRTRRADAVVAATLLQAMPVDAGDPDLPALRAELTEVVAARRELDPGLRARADRVAAQVRVELERDYVRASVVDTLAGLGYEVEQGFATVTGNPDRIRLVRPDWDEHAVQVVVDGDEVRAAVVRLAGRTGTDARRADVEHEEQWCDDLVRLRASLDESGLHIAQRSLVPPGARVLPVVRRHDEHEPRKENIVRERPL